jgi:hypothetical protein
MDADHLAERDRARRLRQLKHAKLQGLALITCVVLGVAYALVSYFTAEPKKQPEKDVPEQRSVVVKPEVVPSKETAAPPAPPAADRVKAPTPGTITRTPPGMSKLVGDPEKTAAPLTSLLATIGATDSERTRRALPKVNEARRVLELLAKTQYISGKLEYVINKPGVEMRMKDYYETRSRKDPEVGEQVADFEVEMAGERYLDVVYKNPTRPSGTLRASFSRDEKGIVRLDWESLVGYSAMEMREFREKKPEEGVTMRVFASVDDYYNYEFSEPKKFLSVRLRNADGSEAVNGFCELGGRVATAITARLATAAAADSAASKGGAVAANKRTWAPIIIKARFPARAQSDHCVELLDLMHGQWLAPAGLVE